MSGDWKSGDVAVTQFGVALRVACEVEAHRGPPSEHWRFVDGSMGASGISARPLVVIDPEDAEQVDRLCDGLYGGHAGNVAARVQHALREFATPTPPKPDEPRGRYAVVEDETALEWVHADVVGVNQWKCLTLDRWADYADITVTRVLSEGVTTDQPGG